MAGTSNYISHLWDVITCPFPWCLLLAQHFELWLGLYDANNYRVWWRHCVGALPHYCPFVREIHWSLVDPCLKGPVRRSFAVFWIVCLNRLLNKRSKCWRSETQLCTYDVSLMKLRELIVHVHIVFGVANWVHQISKMSFVKPRLLQTSYALQWHHNERYVVSNHQPHDCLLNRLFRRRWKNTNAPRHWPLWEGILRWPVNSFHKGPITRKMFPFADVIVFSES